MRFCQNRFHIQVYIQVKSSIWGKYLNKEFLEINCAVNPTPFQGKEWEAVVVTTTLHWCLVFLYFWAPEILYPTHTHPLEIRDDH